MRLTKPDPNDYDGYDLTAWGVLLIWLAPFLVFGLFALVMRGL